MCRFFALIGKDIPAYKLLMRFRDLAEHGRTVTGGGHKDGWGIVAIDHDISRARSELHAGEDHEFEEFARSLGDDFSGIVMAHLRKASDKRTINLSNCHPFIVDDMVFMHNGSIDGFGDETRCDTRAFFEDVLSKESGSAQEALKKGVRSVSNKSGSITSVFYKEGTLAAVRQCKEHADYFTLFLADRGDFMVLSQEKEFLKKEIPVDAWKEIKNGEFITLKLADDGRPEVIEGPLPIN